MIKLFKWILVRKAILIYRYNLVMGFLAQLLGYNWQEYQEKRFDKKKKRRLAVAIEKAERLRLLHNGTRYFVLESNRKGYYEVMNRDEILEEQKRGTFSSRATILDFFREASYYTESGTLNDKKDQIINSNMDSLIVIIAYLVALSIGLTILVFLLLNVEI